MGLHCGVIRHIVRKRNVWHVLRMNQDTFDQKWNGKEKEEPTEKRIDEGCYKGKDSAENAALFNDRTIVLVLQLVHTAAGPTWLGGESKQCFDVIVFFSVGLFRVDDSRVAAQNFKLEQPLLVVKRQSTKTLRTISRTTFPN
uniref:Uncharacterized protein n=1 Tax=Angiostrongylus cantonensis TaxID=6313 RepID=A0A158P895_ANGCA